MAKKENVAVEETKQEVEVVEPDTVKNENIEKTDKKAKNNKDKKSTKKQPAKSKNGIGTKIKESVSEIKKVNWPTFKKVLKQTGMVIAVVVICTLVLFGFDRLLSLLFTWLAY